VFCKANFRDFVENKGRKALSFVIGSLSKEEKQARNKSRLTSVSGQIKE